MRLLAMNLVSAWLTPDGLTLGDIRGEERKRLFVDPGNRHSWGYARNVRMVAQLCSRKMKTNGRIHMLRV